MPSDTNVDTIDTEQTIQEESSTTEQSAPVSEAIAVAAAKRQYPVDTVNKTVSVDGDVYALDDLSDAIKEQLALLGLRDALRTGKAFSDLKAGKLRITRVGAEPKAPSSWRQAIIAGMIELAKKEGSPLTEAEANARLNAATRGQMTMLRNDPIVVKHYQRITKGVTPLAALLAGKSVEPEADATDVETAADQD